jgi:hypothetical protein
MWSEVICFPIATEDIERLVAGAQLNQALGTYQIMLTRAEELILVRVVRATSQAVLEFPVLALVPGIVRVLRKLGVYLLVPRALVRHQLVQQVLDLIRNVVGLGCLRLLMRFPCGFQGLSGSGV